MTVIEHGGAAFEPESPEWREPGMSARDVAIWEAAERAAASAPVLSPADDVYLELRPLLGGALSKPTQERGAA